MKAQLLYVAAALFAALALVASPAEAALLNRAAEPVAAPAAEGNCCPKPCIQYHEHRPCKKICCTCDPPHTVVLKVKDPCTCCVYDVPVCVPACCTEAPCVDDHCGIFGRYVYEYDWCCGYRVVVRFDPCGNITVVYRG